MRTAAQFDPRATRAVLDAAGDLVGLDTRHAQLIRLGENALFRLPDDGLVARVGRSVHTSRTELAVANWLAAFEFPANRAAVVDAPLVVEGSPVTFWELVKESDVPPTASDLGKMLRHLHELPAPASTKLPAFEPMPKIPARLNAFGHLLAADDLEYLHERVTEVEQTFYGLKFALPQGPIHGDAHIGNLMRNHAGEVLLIDFGDFALGPREWDVCVAAYGYEAFGWLDSNEYYDYVAAYGFDPLDWPGYSTLRAARELNMTTWLLQLIGHSDRARHEVGKRIADLRQGLLPRSWSAF